MKKIVLFILVILIIFSLYACAEPKVDSKEDEITKEPINFPYSIELDLCAMQLLLRVAMYNVVINKTEDAVELTLKYNDRDYEYFPEGIEFDIFDPDKIAILKHKGEEIGGPYSEEDKAGKEIIEIDLDYYEHEETVSLSEEQYEEISDIIAKIQGYGYDRRKEESFISNMPITAPYTEAVGLSIQNVETGEKNEIDYKYFLCEYFLIYDENLKELIKKIVELSPVPIVNWWEKPLRFDDSENRSPPK